jgi:ATP-dependent DNA helicase RecQ
MKVLIVAKTRRGGGACVGGITEAGRSVRLIAKDAASNERAGLEYEVGEVWEVETAPDPGIIPPHIENVIVLRARRLRRSAKMMETIRRFMPPMPGGPDKLFDSLTQATTAGGLYIAQRTGVPQRSTMFWLPDLPLQLDCEGKRIRYRYPTADGGRTVTFVGFQDPVPELPAGTLLRLSLAHWWRPKERPEDELRCFVQLSGWFLERPVSSRVGLETPDTKHQTLDRPQFPNSKSPGACLEFGGPAPSAGRNVPVRPLTPALSPSEGESGGQARGKWALGGMVPMHAGGRNDALNQRAADILKRTFGFSRFLPIQAETITRLLARRDTLVVLPTGGGKSLCYELPALVFDGLTVVVSPLIALMEDQVSHLRQLRVPTACLNHMVAIHEYTAIMNQVREGRIKILYLAPETLLRPETLLLLQQSRLACLAIDEAHCISEWGHDFRPEYRQLDGVRGRFPQAVCLALTATATPRVREDIRRLLGIAADGEFVASFDRRNLFLAVERREDELAQVLTFLENRRGQSGIIYCGTRKQTGELCASLTANGWPALPYHAGLEDAVRQRNQERFIRDETPLMVATVAFGMGINKPNVRFVLHAHLPQSLESYYQEIGRAGRDGLLADCLLLYSLRDVIVHRHFISEGAESERPAREERLRALVRFAETRQCRRKLLLAYFGERLGSRCGRCDTCVPKPAERAADHNLAQRGIVRPLVRRRFHEIGELFARGRSLEQIAQQFNVLPETVLQHLYRFHGSGRAVEAERLLSCSRLPESQRAKVFSAFKRLGWERLAPVHESFCGKVPYQELHLLRLYVLCREGGKLASPLR